MNKFTLILTTLLLVSQFALAIAADPGTLQLQRPPMQHQRESVQPLQITPEYLNQKILILTPRAQALQRQVTSLKSVVQVNPHSATIHPEPLVYNAQKNLTMTSGKETTLTIGDNHTLNREKTLSLKGDQDVTEEGGGKLKLKVPQMKLNDSTKRLGILGSLVTGEKAINRSSSPIAKEGSSV